MKRHILWMATLILLCSCGGDSKSPSPPSNLSYSSPQVFVVDHQIATLLPTVSGTVDSYSIQPALPAGLTLNVTTGAISGTPTNAVPLTNYTVRAANGGGATTASLSITVVNDTAPDIAYDSTQFSLTIGVPTADIEPSNGGGDAVAWSIDMPLPPGLIFDTSDGSIGGTPTAISSQKSYVVTATNSGGVSTFALTISIESGVLLDLGHADSVELLRYEDARVLSQDSRGHWVLWDSQTAENLSSGDSTCEYATCTGEPDADLAGSTIVVETPTGFEIHSSSDGHLLANVAASLSWWKLASDGSYVCGGNQSGLTVWSPSGNILFSRTGNYSQALVFAAADEIRVGGGPAGANVVETIAVPSGASSLSSTFQGEFHSWFLDGERFIARVSNTVWIYSKSVAQEDLVALSTVNGLAGTGNWFWTQNVSLNIHAVGGGASPSATYNLSGVAKVVPSEKTIGILLYDRPQLSVIDLSGVAPSKTDYSSPVPFLSAYAAAPNGEWLTGNTHGLIFDGSSTVNTPRYFGLGKVWSIAGSDTRVAIATALGSILYFDAATKVLEGKIDFSSSEIQLSTDGKVLLAAANSNNAQYQTNRSLKVFSLPSGTEVNSWPYSYPNYPIPFDVSLSGSGQFFGKVLGTFGTFTESWTFSRDVVAVADGALVWSDSVPAADDSNMTNFFSVRLSPDATHIAVADEGRTPTNGTKIFKNGVLETAVSGWPVGWIDNNRVLVNKYSAGRFGDIHYEGSHVLDSTGHELATPALPELWEFQTLNSDRIYSPEVNSIFSLSDGDSIWTSAYSSRGMGAAAGSRIFFTSDATVRVEPY